jgi:hypothetical protein
LALIQELQMSVGLPLGAPSLTPSAPAHAATHRNVMSGLLFRASSADPRQHAQLLAPDGWRSTGWVNRDLGSHPFEAIGSRATDTERNFSPSAGVRKVAQSHATIVTRTCRTHAAIPIANGEALTVQTSRRAAECAAGIQLLYGIHDGAPDHAAHLLLQPATARQLARALLEAAAAVDHAQRNPQFTRGGAHHG